MGLKNNDTDPVDYVRHLHCTFLNVVQSYSIQLGVNVYVVRKLTLFWVLIY